jgi:hypothetical protein
MGRGQKHVNTICIATDWFNLAQEWWGFKRVTSLGVPQNARNFFFISQEKTRFRCFIYSTELLIRTSGERCLAV